MHIRAPMMVLSPLIIACIVVSALYFLLVIFFIIGWLRLRKPATAQLKAGSTPFVSIIIPVRNEEPHIKACLESIFSQNYPKDLFEVIAIDDYSTDDSLDQMRDRRQWNLKILDLRQYLGVPGEETPNKKKAIALGVKNAKGELIITTDGDCTMGENWLATMVSAYQQGNCKMVTGPVAIKPAKGPFAWFQQLEVINLSALAAATIRNGISAICTGANLLFSKETFLAVDGFKGNYDVPAGDDIFLMQKIEKKYPGSIGYVKHMDACVYTKTTSFAEGYISQRIRWISKSTDFSDWKFSLMIYFRALLNILVVVAAVFAFFPREMSWLPLAILGGTLFISDLLFNVPVTLFFRQAALLLFFPVAAVFHLLHVIFIGVLSLAGKYDWKGRSV